MKMLLAIFFPPGYFFAQRKFVAGLFHLIVWAFSIPLLFVFGVGFFIWFFQVFFALWDLRRQTMLDHATMIAEKMAERFPAPAQTAAPALAGSEEVPPQAPRQQLTLGIAGALVVVCGAFYLLPRHRAAIPPNQASISSAPQAAQSGSATVQPNVSNAGQTAALPYQAPIPFEPQTQVGRATITLGDSNAKSIWSTSVYSYADGGGTGGGGREDDQLRVGGWGDTYASLIQFPLPDSRPVKSAVLVLHTLPDGHAPTPIILRVISQNWDWRRGDRLWWRDLPAAQDQRTLSQPAAADGDYSIDITDIYNQWATGAVPNYGVMLFPVNTTNTFDTFASTRAQEAVRPRLVLSY